MLRDDSVKKVLNCITYMYILSYVFPSGAIAGLPIQKVLISIIIISSSMIFVHQGCVLEIVRESLFEVLVAVVGLAWCLAGWYKGELWSITVFSLLYIGAVILLVFKYLLKYRYLDINMIIRCLLFMILIKIALKLFVETAFVAGVLDYEGVSQFYLRIFHTEVTTMTMDFGNVELVRIQDSSDAIVFTLLPFFWLVPERKRSERIILVFFMAVYAMIVFSRVYLLEFACFVLITVIYYWKQIPRNQKAIGVVFAALVAIVLARPVIEMLKFRFFSSFTVESDTTRAIQMRELWGGISDKLWFGHGMGSYLPDYIRSEMFPFSYELEYLSFVYQLGIIGFLLIIGGIIGIFLKQLYPYFRKNSIIVRVISMLGIGWFLFRPLLNPAFLGKQNQFLLIGIFLINVWHYSKADCAIQTLQ